jgi:hypothetical protein
MLTGAVTAFAKEGPHELLSTVLPLNADDQAYHQALIHSGTKFTQAIKGA